MICTMADSLCPSQVEHFLERNPKFVKNWMSNTHASADTESGSIMPRSCHSFFQYVKYIITRENGPQNNESVDLSLNDTFIQILKELAFELDEDKLCFAILQNTCILLQCDRASIYNARGTENNRFLISRYIYVTRSTKLAEFLLRRPIPIKFPFGEGILGHVAESKSPLNIKDITEVQCSEKEAKYMGSNCTSILCMPILNRWNKVMGVIKVENSKGNVFTNDDESFLGSLLSFSGIGIDNSNIFKVCLEEHKRHQLLLKLTKCILKAQNNLPELISKVLQHAMAMFDCKSIYVYLVDNEMIAPKENSKVFQLVRNETEVTEVTIDKRFINPVTINLESENVFDIFDLNQVRSSSNLEKHIESWLICMSIRDAKGIAVGSLMFISNMESDFNETDIRTMEMFATFCGLSIFNCRLYETSVRLLSYAEITNEIITYHTTCSEEMIEYFQSKVIKSSQDYQIYRFDFDGTDYSEDQAVLVCVKLFLELDVIDVLNISETRLFAFILTVRNNYRPNIYHNWYHALNVTQAMFCMLTTGNMQNYFTKFEQICLLLACLCHDLDHRGQNNAFQIKIESSLSVLYSTSMLENHHIDRCMLIINNVRTNIFKNLPIEKYQEGLKLLERAIVATDIMKHFNKRNIFKHEVESGNTTFNTPESKDLLISMLMVACDTSAAAKPWEIHSKITAKAIAEYFEQGDLEKHLHCKVFPLMDRRKIHEIPKMNADFIGFVCLPVYKLLATLEERLKPLHIRCVSNKIHWRLIASGKDNFDIDEALFKSSGCRVDFDKKSGSSKSVAVRNSKLSPSELVKVQSPITLNFSSEPNISPWSQSQPIYKSPSFVPNIKKMTKWNSSISVCPVREKLLTLSYEESKKRKEKLTKRCQTDSLNVKTTFYYHKRGDIGDNPKEGGKHSDRNLSPVFQTKNNSAIINSNINESETKEYSTKENNDTNQAGRRNNSPSTYRNDHSTLAQACNESIGADTAGGITTLIQHSSFSAFSYHGAVQVPDDTSNVSEQLSETTVEEHSEDSNSYSSENSYREVHAVEYDFTEQTDHYRPWQYSERPSINRANRSNKFIKSYACVIF